MGECVYVGGPGQTHPPGRLGKNRVPWRRPHGSRHPMEVDTGVGPESRILGSISGRTEGSANPSREGAVQGS